MISDQLMPLNTLWEQIKIYRLLKIFFYLKINKKIPYLKIISLYKNYKGKFKLD